MEPSRMSIEFHNWLSQCPVRWHRDNHEVVNGLVSATYTFIEDLPRGGQ